jgi:hypothetical protein
MHDKASSDMGGGSSSNHFSHTSSRKNLDMFSGGASKEFNTV